MTGISVADVAAAAAGVRMVHWERRSQVEVVVVVVAAAAASAAAAAFHFKPARWNANVRKRKHALVPVADIV